jgi:hypothetical protein
MSNQAKSESLDIFEICLFTNLVEIELRHTPISQLDLALTVIELQFNLNRNRAKDFKKCRTMLINSVKNN